MRTFFKGSLAIGVYFIFFSSLFSFASDDQFRQNKKQTAGRRELLEDHLPSSVGNFSVTPRIIYL